MLNRKKNGVTVAAVTVDSTSQLQFEELVRSTRRTTSIKQNGFKCSVVEFGDLDYESIEPRADFILPKNEHETLSHDEGTLINLKTSNKGIIASALSPGTTATTASSSGVSSSSGSCEDLLHTEIDNNLKSNFPTNGDSTNFEPSDDDEELLRDLEDGESLDTNGLVKGVQDYEYEEQSGSFRRKTVSLSPSPTSSNLSLNDLIGDYESEMDRPKKVYKVVLTGGPCGGKTTGQARLCTFFENLGWKVFRVPEAANILLGGGIKFSELSDKEAFKFQEQLLRTMMQVESVFFTMADSLKQDVLIICDRGAMDASAFIPRYQWEEILRSTKLNEVDIRDSRYNQIIHMVSAANGAEPFYTLEDHACRSESLELARRLDTKAAQAWVGHPYFDVVDNSTDFETKVCRMIQCVCQKLGIDARDRLQTNAKKVKFLVRGPLPADNIFPSGFQDFAVVHDYLQTNGPKMQARLRKRGQKGHWSYTYTVRRPELQGQVIEVKTALTQRDYFNMLSQKDHNHVTVFKTRRCILLNDQYFQLDVYKDPCHPRCKGLILLETYSTLTGEELQQRLPIFLDIVKEVTGDPRYSMFNLSLKERWADNSHFCQSLAGTELGAFTLKNSVFCTNENGLAGY